MNKLLRALLVALALAFAPSAFAQRDPEKPINIPLNPTPNAPVPVPGQATPERGVPALQSFVAACSAILVMVIICYPSRKM